MKSFRYSIRKRAEIDFGAESTSFGDQFFARSPSWRKELVTAGQLFNSRGYGSTVTIDEGLHFDQRAIVATFLSTRGLARPSVPEVSFYDWLCRQYPVLMVSSDCTLLSVLEGAGNSPAAHDNAQPSETQRPVAEIQLWPEGLGPHLSIAVDSAEKTASSTNGVDPTGSATQAGAIAHLDDSWENPCPNVDPRDKRATSPDDREEDDTLIDVAGVGDHERGIDEGVPFSLEPPPTRPTTEEFVEVFVEDDEEGEIVLWGDSMLCLVPENCDPPAAKLLANALAVSQDDGTALLIASFVK